jgi:hypothetical protein
MFHWPLSSTCSNEGGPGPRYNMKEDPGSSTLIMLVVHAYHPYTMPLFSEAGDKETSSAGLPPPIRATCARIYRSSFGCENDRFHGKKPKTLVLDRIRTQRPVLRIRDVYPGSRILIFTHPGSRIPDPGSRISDPGSRIQKQQQKREVKKN